jgi:hypothetical protein
MATTSFTILIVSGDPRQHHRLATKAHIAPAEMEVISAHTADEAVRLAIQAREANPVPQPPIQVAIIAAATPLSQSDNGPAGARCGRVLHLLELAGILIGCASTNDEEYALAGLGIFKRVLREWVLRESLAQLIGREFYTVSEP